MTVQSLPVQARSAAPGQYLGYSLQQVRLCYHLLTAADDEFVSLELVEDIAVHRLNGTTLLEQAKSALSGNPAANKSADLWKTFANWVDICNECGLDPNETDFRYYVSPSKSGGLLSDIVNSITKQDALKVLAKIKKTLVGMDPNLEWVAHVGRFLKAGDSVCATIIERASFVSETDPIEGISDRLNYVPAEVRPECCAAIVGLARDRIDALIRSKKPRAIRAADFRRAVRTFLSRHDFSNVLLPSLSAPEDYEIEALVATDPLFVRQLKVIEVTPALMMTAVSDYMRTTADKVRWAERGVVLEDSFDELDTQLERQHRLVCDEIDDVEEALPATRRGREVYRRCSATHAPLDGQSLPTYFVAGAFNSLAHDRRVGWHPDYLALFPAE